MALDAKITSRSLPRVDHETNKRRIAENAAAEAELMNEIRAMKSRLTTARQRFDELQQGTRGTLRPVR